MMFAHVQRDSTPSRRPGLGALVLGAGLAAGSPNPAHAVETGEKPAIHAAAPHVARQVGGRSLDERVAMLSRALDLDARQRAELKVVLEDQREQVGRVWSDTSVPAPYRVSATQAISDRTADRIRALLNEEQRKRYKPPRRPHDNAPGSVRPSVEAWMHPGTAT